MTVNITTIYVMFMQLCILMSFANGVVGNCMTLNSSRRGADKQLVNEVLSSDAYDSHQWCLEVNSSRYKEVC